MRQATFIVLAIVAAIAGWSLMNYMSDKVLPLTDLMLIEVPEGQQATPELLEKIESRRAIYDMINGYGRYVVPMVVVFGGLWLAFRLVNIPRFADFLIAVEAEMNKVSWPTRAEMFRSSMVVIVSTISSALALRFVRLRA